MTKFYDKKYIYLPKNNIDKKKCCKSENWMI